MKPGATNEGGGGMAIATIQAGRNMILMLAGCRHTMTGVTPRTVRHATMIERCRNEATRIMTDTAILIGLNMIVWFTCGECTVMAGLAVIHNANMIKGSRYKTRGQVAHTAIIVGWHVLAVFSCGDVTIVTGSAVVDDSLVIKPGTGKGRGVMAYRAILRGREMIV